ncbi:hypothetical protein M378DRAFT_15332 [Amanita muscaria Koide BX008]|uniref:Uncharacterized protein n=1 Tax=Amanita muscaria (strain Koide BX008) TaxID=946122 RepID=A0A0C2WBN2_AMAMK|nr:hypothetical protein M378DRAFT_15332 [Amanita muscaria Koide BX008]
MNTQDSLAETFPDSDCVIAFHEMFANTESENSTDASGLPMANMYEIPDHIIWLFTFPEAGEPAPHAFKSFSTESIHSLCMRLEFFHRQLDELAEHVYDVAVTNPDPVGLKFIIKQLLLVSTLCLASVSHLACAPAAPHCKMNKFAKLTGYVTSAGQAIINCYNAVSSTPSCSSRHLSTLKKDIIMTYGHLFSDYYSVLRDFPGWVSVKLLDAQDDQRISSTGLQLLLLFVDAALLVTMHIPPCSYLGTEDNKYLCNSVENAWENITSAINSLD